MKVIYSRPIIVKLGNPLLAKHGGGQKSYQKIREEIDGIKIDDLTKKYGSPLFVFSEKQLRKQMRSIKEEFRKIYPHFCFGWSYKTNYLKGICSLFHH